MKVLSPSQHPRLNEVTGFLLLSLGLVVLLSLVSYHAQDPSWDTAASARPHNLVGYPGSYIADLLYQAFGIAAFLFPLLIFLLSWKWIRSEEVEAGAVKVAGTVLLCLGLCTSLSFTSSHLFRGTVRIGGTVGFVVGRWLLDSLNLAGALVATGTAVVVSVYLVSSFTISRLNVWAAWFRVPRER